MPQETQGSKGEGKIPGRELKAPWRIQTLLNQNKANMTLAGLPRTSIQKLVPELRNAQLSCPGAILSPELKNIPSPLKTKALGGFSSKARGL